ncbi:Uncharacterised protein [uncultured archaeon]|nr:Uncharacterised protein [uncultured archaeon]
MSFVALWDRPLMIEYIPADEINKRCTSIFNKAKQGGDAEGIASKIAKENQHSATYVRLCMTHEWFEPVKLANAKPGICCMKICFDDVRKELRLNEKIPIFKQIDAISGDANRAPTSRALPLKR